MLLVFPTPSPAAPELVLRDRIDIRLDPIRRIGSMVEVKGRLVQRGDGEGAPYLNIRLQLDDRWVTILSDGNGYFFQRFAAEEGEHLLSVDVNESSHFEAAHFEMADFDIGKRPLALSVIVPDSIADTEPELLVEIGASTDGAPVALALQLYLGDSDGNLARIADARTDDDGRGLVTISQTQLGAPGRKRVELRFAGDDGLDPATASGTFKITSSSALQLRVDGKSFDYGDSVPVSGRLEDGRGEPIAGAPITLEAQSQAIASTKTDERGDFRFQIDSEELGSGTAIVLQALYRPTESWKDSARSAPSTIAIGTRKPIPLSLPLAAFVVTGLGLVSFVGMRSRPWERLRKPAGSDEQQSEADDTVAETPPTTGLVTSRRKLSNTFRKPHYMDFEGVVRDTMNKEPIAQARIEVQGAAGQLLETSNKGTFRTAALYAGEHAIAVSADGYVTEEIRVTVPHRGEYHGATVEMLPVREKIFALYKEALRPRLPDPGLWGIWTPRQILDHVRSSQPGEALAVLTDFVEESFFSQRNPNEDILPRALELIRAFRKERPS